MFWKRDPSPLELDKAKFELLRIQIELCPHMVYNAAIVREGSRWCCTLPCHSDPLQCVTAYGDSPQQACLNFDALWNTNPPDFEEDELEQF